MLNVEKHFVKTQVNALIPLYIKNMISFLKEKNLSFKMLYFVCEELAVVVKVALSHSGVRSYH